MEWYYTQDGQSIGPISDPDFEELVRKETIQPRTLVWHEGMAGWQALQTIRAPPVLDETAACSNCGKPYPRGEMISYGGHWICAACKPVFVQKLKEGVDIPSNALWRSGKVMVMSLTANLPARCVKCNAPAPGSRLERNLYWHHPLVYLALLLNLLIYAVVAICLRRRARIQVGLCETHRSRRKRDILIAWVVALGGVGAFSFAMYLERFELGLVSLLVTIIAMVYGIATTRIVWAKRIDQEHIWLKGVCREYLDALPEWNGPP